MPYFMERKRLRDVDAREATGESFWTENLPPEATRKIILAIAEAADVVREPILYEEPLTALRRAVQRDTGVAKIPQDISLLVNEDTDLVLSYVEATYDLLESFYQHARAADHFAKTVNAVLQAHRIKYRFVPENGQIVPLDSEELHSTVVEPTLLLLHGRPDLADAHESYLNALKEISENEPANAITDAATALQRTLVELGCRGNALGPLIADAKKRGLFAGHDENLVSGISKFMEWASADRSEKGDGHKPGTKDLADAWLMVHVVGALIVRLAEGSPRQDKW